MKIFEVSQGAADLIFNAANIGLIVGAALVLIATIAVFWTGGIRERYADIRISGNETETAKANADVGKANAEITKAKAAIAEANARTLEAQLALERYKSPRTLTSEQQIALIAQLTRFTGTTFDVAIGPMGDPEPLYLARSIHSALSAAGWVQVAWIDGGMAYTEASDWCYFSYKCDRRCTSRLLGKAWSRSE